VFPVLPLGRYSRPCCQNLETNIDVKPSMYEPRTPRLKHKRRSPLLNGVKSSTADICAFGNRNQFLSCLNIHHQILVLTSIRTGGYNFKLKLHQIDMRNEYNVSSNWWILQVQSLPEQLLFHES
jgi:hypothetical protein